eukprot:scaffold106_cov380-Prasinococcus_capsulatus_cf.AAC.12
MLPAARLGPHLALVDNIGQEGSLRLHSRTRLLRLPLAVLVVRDGSASFHPDQRAHMPRRDGGYNVALVDEAEGVRYQLVIPSGEGGVAHTRGPVVVHVQLQPGNSRRVGHLHGAQSGQRAAQAMPGRQQQQQQREHH